MREEKKLLFAAAEPVDRESQEQALLFVRVWAEAVLRQVERVRAIRAKQAKDGRNYERMEDWSPTGEDLEENFRAQWAEEHTLVWAAFQLEQWTVRWDRERGRKPRPEDPLLRNVRNALEHLTEAAFAGGRALPPQETGQKGSGLRSLPGGGLDIELDGRALFGLIDSDDLQKHALDLVRGIHDALVDDAAERYLALAEDL